MFAIEWSGSGMSSARPKPTFLVAIYRVQASGGAFTAITKLDASKQEGMHLWPHLLPGGRHFLFTIRSGIAGHGGLYAGSLDGKPAKFLVGQDSSGCLCLAGLHVLGRG